MVRVQAEGSTPGERLRSLRKREKLSQEVTAEEIGVSRVMLTKYETGAHPIPDHVIERFAQRFGVTPAWIRYGDTASRMAPVIGWVGAGAVIDAVEHAPQGYVEVPGSWVDAYGVRVVSDSMLPDLEEGDTLVFRGDPRFDEGEVLGRLSVVELDDGRGLVKRVRRGSEPGRYTLESTNARPIENVRIASARRVLMHFKATDA